MPKPPNTLDESGCAEAAKFVGVVTLTFPRARLLISSLPPLAARTAVQEVGGLDFWQVFLAPVVPVVT